MSAAIVDIATHLPARVLDNEELARAFPDWNIDLVSRHSGVVRRHVAAANETALDLGLEACGKLFERHPELRDKVDVLLFCTQTADYPLPSNACVLHGKLALPETVGAFDINLACSGFCYGLAVANGMILSKTARNILAVTADTFTKYIHERDRSTRVLFGDGAAVTWISAAEDGSGVRDVAWGTDGRQFAKAIIPAGGFRTPHNAATCVEEEDESGNVRTAEHVYMAGKAILKFTYFRVPTQVREILARNSLTVEDIDLFIFHQASGMVLDNLTLQLKLPPEKVFRNLEDVGNTMAASIPIALHDAVATGRVARGNLLVLSGFGAGLSWATVLVRY